MDSNQLGIVLAVAQCTWTSFVIGPSLSTKAGFLSPARKPGSLIFHISWVFWTQLRNALVESASREKAAPEKGQLKAMFVSESYWQLCAGEDIDKAKPMVHPHLIVQLSNFPFSLLASAGGGGYRPFTHTVRQMSYLLSQER